MAYNDKIIIQQPTEARNDYGGITSSWATYKTAWAEIDQEGGNVSFESEIPVFSDRNRFKIRTHDAPAVTSKMRISYDSQIWLIDAIQKEGRLFTVLTATAHDDE